MQPSTEQDAVNEGEVRAELSRILSSPEFCHSPQLQRLLTFIVSESLSGRASHLKEYTLGVEVFARPASYDPRLDSLVRVEAKRLRTLLEQYYAERGVADSVRIEIPKGSYVPRFQTATRTPTEQEPTQNRLSRMWMIAVAVLIPIVVLTLYVGLRVRRSKQPRYRIIAVLPFENLSHDPENEYLCFALMDEVTTDLAKQENLRVIARTSASRVKRGDDIATIARQLNADTILEGSVSKRGDRVRVSVQLINAADSIHIWAGNFERSGEDQLVLQSEISIEIARAVTGQLVRTGRREIPTARYSKDLEANRLYWKGAYFRAPIGTENWRDNLQKSERYFEEATHRDAMFAAAYSALADVCATLAYESGGGPVTAERMACARQAATRALQLDESNSEAYGALGTVQFSYDYDHVAAEKSFQRALQLNPSDARVHMWYAVALAPQGRLEEAIAQAREAKDLDPLSFATSNHLAGIIYFNKDYDEAARLARETLEMDSKIAPAHAILGMVCEERGSFDEAINEYKTALILSPNHPFITGRLGHAYALANRRAEANRIIAETEEARKAGRFSHVYTAYVYVGLGDTDRVFDELELAYQRRDPDLPFIAVDPIFGPVRNDPRYAIIVKKLGLGQLVQTG